MNQRLLFPFGLSPKSDLSRGVVDSKDERRLAGYLGSSGLVEFYVGERVRIRPGADVSDHAAAHDGLVTVEGYEEVDDVDYVIVKVPAMPGRVAFTQLVSPEEIEPEGST